MIWKVADLSEGERRCIGFDLPADWQFRGVPGEHLWAVFECPFCGAGNEGGRRHCRHLKYIFNHELNDYVFLDTAFLRLTRRRIRERYGTRVAPPDSNIHYAPSPRCVCQTQDQSVDIRELFDELVEIAFRAECDYARWSDIAGFVP